MLLFVLGGLAFLLAVGLYVRACLKGIGKGGTR